MAVESKYEPKDMVPPIPATAPALLQLTNPTDLPPSRSSLSVGYTFPPFIPVQK